MAGREFTAVECKEDCDISQSLHIEAAILSLCFIRRQKVVFVVNHFRFIYTLATEGVIEI